MKTQTFKFNYQVVLIAIITLGMFISCNNEPAEEQTEESTKETVSTEEETVEESSQIVKDLDNETFKKYLDSKDGILIDVRTAGEYSEGHIEGAINKDYLSGEFESSMDSLDKNKAVFVYCQKGGRSGESRDLLKEAGFSEIYNLENGFGNWEE